MIEISEVLYQWQQGRSKSKIAESLGITRPTLRNYLNLAMAAGLTAVSSPEEVAAIALEVMAKVSGNRTSVAPAREAITVHDERIRKLLDEPDMTARQIWRLLAEAGHSFSERSINRYIQRIAWFARDLQGFLGYSKWENCAKVIDKAKIAFQTAGHVISVTSTSLG